jgi:hypothetical protein
MAKNYTVKTKKPSVKKSKLFRVKKTKKPRKSNVKKIDRTKGKKTQGKKPQGKKTKKHMRRHSKGGTGTSNETAAATMIQSIARGKKTRKSVKDVAPSLNYLDELKLKKSKIKRAKEVAERERESKRERMKSLSFEHPFLVQVVTRNPDINLPYGQTLVGPYLSKEDKARIIKKISNAKKILMYEDTQGLEVSIQMKDQEDTGSLWDPPRSGEVYFWFNDVRGDLTSVYNFFGNVLHTFRNLEVLEIYDRFSGDGPFDWRWVDKPPPNLKRLVVPDDWNLPGKFIEGVEEFINSADEGRTVLEEQAAEEAAGEAAEEAAEEAAAEAAADTEREEAAEAVAFWEADEKREEAEKAALKKAKK